MNFAGYLTETKPVVDKRIYKITDGLVTKEVQGTLLKGKRLRAGLTLAVFFSCVSGQSDQSNERFNEALDLACAVELAHAASLLVDDVIDEDETRRGMPALHISKGVKNTMLETVGLLSIPYSIVAKYNKLYVDILSQTQRKMVSGAVREIADIANIKDLPASNLYDFIITQKTGRLFSLAALYGAMAAGASMHTYENFSNYGLRVGKCMQIADDIYDLIEITRGGKKSNFGSEMLLLRCVVADHLIHEFVADLKSNSLDFKKVKLLWEREGVKQALENKLEKEISIAIDELLKIKIPNKGYKDLLILAPRDISSLMLHL